MRKCILTMFFLLGFISISSTASSTELNSFSWLGLWNSPMLMWGENKNRLEKRCPMSLSEVEVSKCKEDHLKTKTWIIPVYADAAVKSEKVGEIRIAVTPSESFKYSFWSSLTDESISFRPDIFDPDWGYGPYLHQTVIERKGAWVKLPKNPFPKNVWINLNSNLVQKELMTIQRKDVYILEEKNLIVLKVEKNKLFVRVQQDADFWCEPGKPPPLKKRNPFWIGKKELWDNNQHLKLRRAHTRGC